MAFLYPYRQTCATRHALYNTRRLYSADRGLPSRGGMARKPKRTSKFEYTVQGIGDAQVQPVAPGAGIQIPLLTVRAVADLGAVGRGQTAPHVLSTADGREFLCKRPEFGYALVAEFVCARLCNQLGLAVPEPAIVWFQNQHHLGSSYIPKKDAWLPGRVHSITNPEAAGPLMVVDIFSHNNDRHRDNIVLEQVVREDGKPGHKLWGIDFGNTVFRDGRYFRSIDGPPVHAIVHRNSPLHGLVTSREQLDPTIEALVAVTADEIDRLLMETPPEWWLEGRTTGAKNRVVEFFLSRQAQLRDDVEAVFPALYAGA
jgi:hypothetical protein